MQELSATFSALGDETRRAILHDLCGGERRLSDLAEPFQMTQTAISKHVRILEKANLITVEKRGRVRYCRLHARSMKEAATWLADYEVFWTAQFDNLAGHFDENEK
jgi:DNA-binding transcriptional ArsR family regulator